MGSCEGPDLYGSIPLSTKYSVSAFELRSPHLKSLSREERDFELQFPFSPWEKGLGDEGHKFTKGGYTRFVLYRLPAMSQRVITPVKGCHGALQRDENLASLATEASPFTEMREEEYTPGYGSRGARSRLGGSQSGNDG